MSFSKLKIKRIVLSISLLSMVSFFILVVQIARMRNDAVMSEVKPDLKEIGVTEHMGDRISMGDLTFKDESGKRVLLGEYFKKGKPVLLNLVYYECPHLCTFVLNGLVAALKIFDWTPGNQFEIVSVSINPQETPELASSKKESYLKSYGRPEASKGWHFLTGKEDQIKKLAQEVGFGFKYDKNENQYAHSAVLFILTPEGRISRYLYGIDYSLKTLRLSLLEASSGKIGNVIDRFLLFCYRYDPQTRKYSVYITNLVQIGCGLVVFLLGGYMFVFWNKQRKGALV